MHTFSLWWTCNVAVFPVSLCCFHQAIDLLSYAQDSAPHIFLITDGSVEDERDICSTMRTHVAKRGSMSPRISTFGVGNNSIEHGYAPLKTKFFLFDVAVLGITLILKLT